MGALVFYAAGWNSFDHAIEQVQDWAHEKRASLDGWLGVENRIDRGHAEIVAMKGMTLDEEVEYISKTYLPDEDWETEEKDT